MVCRFLSYTCTHKLTQLTQIQSTQILKRGEASGLQRRLRFEPIGEGKGALVAFNLIPGGTNSINQQFISIAIRVILAQNFLGYSIIQPNPISSTMLQEVN